MASKYKQYGDLLTVGIMFPVCIAIGYGLGMLVDGWTGTKYTFSLVGVVFGIAAAFVNLFQVVRKFGGNDPTRSE